MLAGLALLSAGLVRAAGVALGYGGVHPLWWWAFGAGLFLVSNVCSYQVGRGDEAVLAQQRARWRDDAFGADVAARSSGAGRPDASLTGVVATPPEPLAGRGVAPTDDQLRAYGDQFLASMRDTDRSCDIPADWQDELNLAETSRPRCACGHFAGTPQGVPPGWERHPVYGWACPHCPHRVLG